MKYVIKVNDIQDAIQQPIRPVVAKDLNNKLYVSAKRPSTPLMKTVFRYSNGSTSESSHTWITKSSYESLIPENAYLTSVEIGNNVTLIGAAAFENCSSLTSVTIPNSVTEISNYAFCGCSSLTSITIPNSVTSIGGCAFYDCSSLTSVTIPNSVTSIGYQAFSECSSLTSINIPNSVSLIERLAFSGCVSLSSIICEVIVPPALETFVFENTNNCPIYVPAQSVDAYKTAENWSEYADRIQAISE